MGTPSSFLAAILIGWLQNYLDQNNLGAHFAPDGMFRVRTGSFRMPDVAFIVWSRVPRGGQAVESIWSMAPDFAIEVLSRATRRRRSTARCASYSPRGPD